MDDCKPGQLQRNGRKKNEILVSADIIDKRKTTNEMQLKVHWKINNKQDRDKMNKD